MSHCGLIGVSLMSKDGKHLCMCLLAICMYSVVKGLFKSFAH